MSLRSQLTLPAIAAVLSAAAIASACRSDGLTVTPHATPQVPEAIAESAVPIVATPGAAATPASTPGAPVPSQIPFPTARPPSPTPTPKPAGLPATELSGDPVVRRQDIPLPPGRDIYELGRRLLLKSGTLPPRVAEPPPPPLTEGEAVRMWVNREAGNVQVTAIVSRVSENAYWLFEEGVDVDRRNLDTAVREFESAVWPKVTGVFGPIWTPGVDGDPRLVILHARLRPGVAGYFSGADSYPRSIQKHSNEREIIYMSTTTPVGTRDYLATLAHELQHAVHWAADADEDTWLNEGLSEVASELAGFHIISVASYLRAPATSLTEWPAQISESGPNYGAAALFFEYFMDHYGGEAALRGLVEEPADGLDAVNRYLEKAGYRERALDVYRDWLVANYLDEVSGRYSHPRRDLHSGVRLKTDFILTPVTVEESLPPLGAHYYVASLGARDVRLQFKGDPVAELFPASPFSGDSCWWGNAGDSIDTTLTRRVDLSSARAGSATTLKYAIWFDIEADWDYAYVEVSTDGGSTWTALPAGATTDANPNGNSYGHAYTGLSRLVSRSAGEGWIEESVDLSAYAGQELQVRFEYITDDAVHGRGVCLDDFAIPEVGWYDDAETPGDWVSEGFARVNNKIPQDYLLLVIRQPADGPAAVLQMPVSGDGSGGTTVIGLSPDEKLAVIISPVTAGVAGLARYTLTVEKGG